MKPLPPFFYLHHILEIDAGLPSGLRWRAPNSKRVYAGAPAGSQIGDKRWVINIDNKKYYCHRIKYYMETGLDPKNKVIDHINRDWTTNQHIRLATISENQCNRNKQKRYAGLPTSSQYKGVSWNKEKSKWEAYITKNNKRQRLGYFLNEKDAAMAYDVAAKSEFKEFAVLNFNF